MIGLRLVLLIESLGQLAVALLGVRGVLVPLRRREHRRLRVEEH